MVWSPDVTAEFMDLAKSKILFLAFLKAMKLFDYLVSSGCIGSLARKLSLDLAAPFKLR